MPLYDSQRFGLLPNGSLAISNATQREVGFYLCAARNGFGPDVTKLIRITVHGKCARSPFANWRPAGSGQPDLT